MPPLRSVLIHVDKNTVPAIGSVTGLVIVVIVQLVVFNVRVGRLLVGRLVVGFGLYFVLGNLVSVVDQVMVNIIHWQVDIVIFLVLSGLVFHRLGRIVGRQMRQLEVLAVGVVVGPTWWTGMPRVRHFRRHW